MIIIIFNERDLFFFFKHDVVCYVVVPYDVINNMLFHFFEATIIINDSD